MKGPSKIDRYRRCIDASVVPPRLDAIAYTYAEAATTESGGKLIYARQDYPGCLVLEHGFAELEGAEESAAFCSGMAAMSSLLMSLERGSSVVVPTKLYWPLQVWLKEFGRRQGIKALWVDSLATDDLVRVLRPDTALVWVEMLSNPELRMVDVRELAARLPANVALAVNATCLSPALVRPLDLGADFVVHSASKLIGGHGDLLAGMVSTGSRRSEIWRRLKRLRWLHGNGLSARDAALLERGLPTLSARIVAASAGAERIARRLERHQAVYRVVYPALESHPDREIARRNGLDKGFGPLLGAYLNLSESDCRRFCERTRTWRNATGFGAVHSCVEHRATAEYVLRQSAPNYVRFSVGLEPVEELIADLDEALRPFCLPMAS